MSNRFFIQGREESEEFLESEKPALDQLVAMGYEYKTQQEINLERQDYRQVLLYDRLKNAIIEINPELDEEGVYDALEQIKEDSFSSNWDVMDTNERIRAKLVGLSRSGGLEPITVTQNLGDGNENKTVYLFDFINPENNDFLVTNQFKMDGLKEPIYPDIVIFVNGIPLVVVECKAPSIRNPIQEAVDGNFARYQDRGRGYEKLMFYNHILIATCGDIARHGSIGTNVNQYARWSEAYPFSNDELLKLCNRKRLREQEILIAGMLSKSHILDILKNYVLYEVINNKKLKKVAKHQQYRVVTKAIDRLHTDKDSTGNKSTLSGKGGVIWHTQGSGKSISMLWLATQLMYKFGNPPILIVTDRKQLDKQIHETFKTCGFPTPIKARTSSHLQTLLQNPQGKTIMTTIQKFGTKSGLIETNAKVIVLVDEGHRTQYKFNAAAMREALPNGTFFAFTGTPIDKKEKSTYRVFGPLLDRYSFDESKADGATLAIKYEGRMAELFVEGENETIEQVFDRVFSDQTKDVKDKLKKQYVTKEKILEAPSRIKKVCLDVIDHFAKNVKSNGLKAMVVASSRQAAVTYKKELDNLNGPISKVIMTSKLGEKGSDGESWDKYYLTDEQSEKEESYFKSPEDPTQILIVVDMLLVGYDAPIVQTLYLDRVIREHTLLQAIARVNRPYRPEKQYGLIIDYCGITKELQQALAIFDERDVQDVMIPFDTEIEQLKLRHAEAMSFFSDINKNNFDEIILKFEPINVREDFEYAFKMFSKAMDSVLPRREAFQYKDDFTFLAKTRQRLKNFYGGVGLSLKIEGNKVQRLINDIIRSSKISTLIEQREVTDETFLSDVIKETKNKKARTALVKNKVRQIIEEKAHLNPVYYEKMKERLEAIIREEREERREDAYYFNSYESILKDLYGQEEERKKLGFTNAFEFAVYETLLKEVEDGNLSKVITKKIFEGIKEEITNIPDWQNKLTSQKKLESSIYDILNETSNKKIEKNIDEIIVQVIELAKRNLT